MPTSVIRPILPWLLCPLLALAGALLAGLANATAEPSSVVGSANNVEYLLAPENRSALSHEARILAAVEPTQGRTKKIDDDKKPKEKSTRPSPEETIDRSGSEELAAVFSFDSACFWTWTARSPPEVLT